MRRRTLQVRLALLGIVVSLFAMDSTFNSKQWHLLGGRQQLDGIGVDHAACSVS